MCLKNLFVITECSLTTEFVIIEFQCICNLMFKSPRKRQISNCVCNQLKSPFIDNSFYTNFTVLVIELFTKQSKSFLKVPNQRQKHSNVSQSQGRSKSIKNRRPYSAERQKTLTLYTCTVKPLHHPRDPKFVVVVVRWLLAQV